MPHKRSDVHERTKHIDVKYHYVRDTITEGKLKICKISTHDNLADMMMKPVPIAKLSWYNHLALEAILAPPVYYLCCSGR